MKTFSRSSATKISNPLIILLILLTVSAVHATPFTLLLETNENEHSGSEVFLASYVSFSDLMDGDLASSSFSQIDIGPGYSVGGFIAIPEVATDLDPIPPVPEPGTLLLFGIGILGLTFASRKKR